MPPALLIQGRNLTAGFAPPSARYLLNRMNSRAQVQVTRLGEAWHLVMRPLSSAVREYLWRGTPVTCQPAEP